MQKKIAYITGTRADFGLMTSVLKAVDKSDLLKLQLYVTGVHLMPEFGNTINYVKNEFPRAKIVNAVFSSGDRLGMAHFMGEYLKELTQVLSSDKPDFILVLGDRVEMLCTALAALYLGIPVGHLHGGEISSTVDEIARHAITKLASIHFAATEESANRIKNLGEEDWRVHVVGAPALDVILNNKLPDREAIFSKLGINPKDRIILVVQHPVTEEINRAGKQMEETIAACKTFNFPVVVTYPHPDPGGRQIIDVLKKEQKNPLFHIFPSLEYESWLSLEREAAVLVGNSSAGMIESASFKLPVVNIGNRQDGRQRGTNVIDVDYNREQIRDAMEKSLYDKDYLAKIAMVKNPWGDGQTADRVRKILEDMEFNEKLLKKHLTY